MIEQAKGNREQAIGEKREARGMKQLTPRQPRAISTTLRRVLTRPLFLKREGAGVSVIGNR